MANKILTNFTYEELATKDGEFNYDFRLLLSLQAFRSWLGLPLSVASGCRTETNDSAHNIYLHERTIPATAIDLVTPSLDTWELMKKVEEFYKMQVALVFGYSDYRDIDDQEVFDNDRILTSVARPIISGRGCYPDTKNRCVHLDMSHLSMNQVLRSKRKGITRWVRTDVDRPNLKAGYHHAKDGETFKQLKARLKI